MGCQLLLDQNKHTLNFVLDLNTPPQPSPSQGREPFSVLINLGVSARPDGFGFYANRISDQSFPFRPFTG